MEYVRQRSLQFHTKAGGSHADRPGAQLRFIPVRSYIQIPAKAAKICML